MKYAMSILLLFMLLTLYAVEVPFSMEMIKTETNHISGMERIGPPDRQPLPLATDCWLWHDGSNMYAYWECEIDSTFIPGAYATRDDSQTSDYIRIQVKTIANEDFAYYFMAYPRGTSYDAVRSDNLQVDKAWNSLYDSESSYSGNLWTCKMTIPFRDLRYDGNPPYQWTFSIARMVQSSGSSYANPYTPITGNTPRQYYDAFEPLTIKEAIDMPRNYYVIPYYYHSFDMLTEESTFDPKHVGVNVVYRPTTNSSVKMAFNPDFTEVPVDEERDSHNDKYPPQLPENRIFFTEDLNAFGVNDALFYSRNIMQPQYAVKFTASGSNWNMGFLSAQDKETVEDTVVINPADTYNLIAFKPQYGRFTTQFTVLGKTNTESDQYNYVFYAAPFYQIYPTWKVQAKFAQSMDKIKDRDDLYGHFATLSSTQTLGKFQTFLYGREITHDYVPGMGAAFAKYDTSLLGGGYSIDYDNNFRDSFFRTTYCGSNGNVNWEHEGNRQIRNYDARLTNSTTFLPRFNFTVNGSLGADRLPNNELIPWNNLDLNIGWDRWLVCSGNVGMGAGNAILYSLADPQHNYKNSYYYAGINGFLGPVISYIFRNNHIIWDDLPPAIEYLSGVRGDNEYDVTNLDMELTFSKNLKLVSGVRYNNYEMMGLTQHVGYFCTMHWFVNSTTKVYAGFKSTEDEYLDAMYKTSETSWFKISRTF